jgi:hypothetical protein
MCYRNIAILGIAFQVAGGRLQMSAKPLRSTRPET